MDDDVVPEVKQPIYIGFSLKPPYRLDDLISYLKYLAKGYGGSLLVTKADIEIGENPN